MGFRLKAVWGKLHRRQLHYNCCSAALRKTNCVRFGRIASLSACVLFAGGCVVGICDESFLDFSFSEFFMFLEWRTAVTLILLDFYYRLLSTLRRGQLAPCTPRRAEPARPQLPAARILQPIIYLSDESKWLPVIQIPTQLTVRQQPLAIPL